MSSISLSDLQEAATAQETAEEAWPQRASDLTPAFVVRWLVKSLYIDEALPRGPLLQWLLRLLCGVKLSHKELLSFAQNAPGLYVMPPSAKKFNFHVLLSAPPVGFSGFVCDDDATETLGAKVWQEAASCLTRGGWPRAEEVQHKYFVVASWLQDFSPRLRALSFGKVLSIVKCSTQSARLLGHRNGQLVPFALSEECERALNACSCQPTHVAPGEDYVKTWEELSIYLRRLLQGCRSVEVSKVKALFRKCFHTELSETVFGHQCLSKLLADPHLAGDFELDGKRGTMYVLRLREGGEVAEVEASKGQRDMKCTAIDPKLP